MIAQAQARGRGLSDGEASKQVLVVDDDDDVRESVSTLLRTYGYEVRTSGDGSAAIAQLRRSPVDLVIFDLRMPVMDGWQFRTVQRADRELSEIPVIAMSADGSAQAAAIHADYYLRKPFDTDELLVAVERVLVLRERQVLSERLRDAERIALLGTIAAGVGHEINNPLTYVFANLDLMRSEISALGGTEEAPRREALVNELQAHLQDARTGADRIREVVASLRWLSRPNQETHGEVDLVEVLETSAAIAWNEIRHRARFEKNLAELPAVQGDPARLGQVFVNLLVNAAQSIAPGATESNQIRLDAFVRGSQVVVEVRDTGAGISPELQAKVFEPFFTTKDPATGTGLGLAISRNIVHEHGGQIELESVPGQGSLFRVLLPLGRAPARPEGPPAVVSDGLSLRTRLLVIDDDPQVLSALSRMLKDDYQVLAMRSARAALDHLVADRAFGVILCDLMMPEVTGMDFHAQLERLYPALARRVVFMTGGAFAPEARDFLRRVSRLCLDKPFTRGELQAALAATVTAVAD